MKTTWRHREEQEAARWADARRHGLTAADQAALELWLSGRPGRSRLLDQHDALLSAATEEWIRRRAHDPREPEPRSWGRAPTTRLPEEGRTSRLLAAGVVTAGVAALALVFLPPLFQGDRLTGAPGSTTPIQLADGSVVRLNGDSAARVALGAGERVVRLEGEGFFEVAADRRRPFSVIAQGVRVIAVGTLFNVDEHGDRVEVVVYEGAVDVTPPQGERVRVAAGDRALVSDDRALLTAPARAVSEDALPDWAEGWLEADAAPLSEVVRELERSSGARIVLKGEGLDRLVVSGRFRLDQPAQVLEGVAAVHGLDLTRQGADGFRLAARAGVAGGRP